MAESITWVHDHGPAELEKLCGGMKAGFKRSLYNQITRAEDALKVAIRATDSPTESKYRIEQASQLARASLEAIKANALGITLLLDKDIINKAAQIFTTIQVVDGVYVGFLGRLEITWREATYYIGDMEIRYQTTPSLDFASRIRVMNHNQPDDAAVPHPHVNSGGNICWGTWKEMIAHMAKDRWNWLRCLVMTAEFLRHYTPEGTPFQALAKGWHTRHISGPVLCRNCDRQPDNCTCIQAGATCPKTGERVPGTLPRVGYCRGCARYVTPAVAETATGICASPLMAEAWLAQNRPVIMASSAPEPEAAAPSSRRPQVDGPPLSEAFMRTYAYAESPSGQVYRCRRPEGVEHNAIRELSISRFVRRQVADRLRGLGVIEFAVAPVARGVTVCHVTEVLRGPSYETPVWDYAAVGQRYFYFTYRGSDTVFGARSQVITPGSGVYTDVAVAQDTPVDIVLDGGGAVQTQAANWEALIALRSEGRRINELALPPHMRLRTAPTAPPGTVRAERFLTQTQQEMDDEAEARRAAAIYEAQHGDGEHHPDEESGQ